MTTFSPESRKKKVAKKGPVCQTMFPLALLILSVCSFVLLLFLYPSAHATLMKTAATSREKIWNMIVTSQLQHGILLSDNFPMLVESSDVNNVEADNYREFGRYHDGKDDGGDGGSATSKNGPKTRWQNHHIKPFLSCPYKLNQNTNHFRIPATPLNDIVFVTSNDNRPNQNKYFNPAILTLPVGSKYQYVVFSRLVTSGSHQETHYCPAMVEDAMMAHDHHPHDDGDNGATERVRPDRHRRAVTHTTNQILRCALVPRALNLPSTPAFRCTGRWSDFADIPGFHDPRVFWSGKGEPLMIVNSASAASPNGCVGMWMIDLRSVVYELEEWLGDRADSTGNSVDDGAADDTLDSRADQEAMIAIAKMRRSQDNDKNSVTPFAVDRQRARANSVKPKKSYPYLTEIMKNPPSTRNPVEKNWVLFFPKEEQAWVMYDVMGHGGQDNSTKLQKSDQTITDDQDRIAISTEPKREPLSTTSLGDISATLIPNELVDLHASMTATKAGQVQSRDSKGESNQNTSFLSSSFASSQSSMHMSLPRISNLTSAAQLERRQNPADLVSDRVDLKPSRSLAKLFGGGYVTRNLTSPDESPCFSDIYTRDKLGNSGKWHQGSNTLRLVLCQHYEHATTHLAGAEKCMLTDDNEDLLVDAGMVVHFMVMHRKFSNALDLPMRYERYFLVWEARMPFRLLGISASPVLFEDERAKPWSDEENHVSHDDEKLAKRPEWKKPSRWDRAYFSYTPSLAWAHRQTHAADGILQHEKGLGTGYLGEEILVGVGMDDVQHGYVKVKVDDVLQCLRLCPDFDQH